ALASIPAGRLNTETADIRALSGSGEDRRLVGCGLQIRPEVNIRVRHPCAVRIDHAPSTPSPPGDKVRRGPFGLTLGSGPFRVIKHKSRAEKCRAECGESKPRKPHAPTHRLALPDASLTPDGLCCSRAAQLRFRSRPE